MSGNGVGRHSNLGGTASLNGDDGKTFGGYWDTFKHKARTAFTDEPPTDEALLGIPEEQSYAESLGELANLTYQQRIIGFFLCIGMGLLFIFLAISMMLFPRKFAFFITVGNVFCMGSTTFLVGISYQIKNMFSRNRFEAACLYVGAIVLTLMSALWLKSRILCLIFAVTQVGAILWYALSFIPYARHTISFVVGYASAILKPVFSVLWQAISGCCNLVSG